MKNKIFSIAPFILLIAFLSGKSSLENQPINLSSSIAKDACINSVNFTRTSTDSQLCNTCAATCTDPCPKPVVCGSCSPTCNCRGVSFSGTIDGGITIPPGCAVSWSVGKGRTCSFTGQGTLNVTIWFNTCQHYVDYCESGTQSVVVNMVVWQPGTCGQAVASKTISYLVC